MGFFVVVPGVTDGVYEGPLIIQTWSNISQVLPVGEKPHTMEALVKEQLDQGHVEYSTSPWNTPIFTIKKKSGK